MNNILRFLAILIILSNIAMTVSAFESGQASWYGGKFQGRKTANGEIFDTNKLTAAHKTLPFNSIVRVTNLKNNLHVDVRINDRGPFVEGRIIDLSHAAADKLDMTVSGIAVVKLDIISLPEGHSVDELKKSSEVHPEGIPSNYKIQVASFSKADNAAQCLEKLKNRNLDAVLEITESGMIRVVIPNIKTEELNLIKNKLSNAGFSSLLVRQN